MIKNKHNFFITKFFDFYTKKIIKSDFNKIVFDKNFKFDSNKSILLIGNHYSWWDGFWVYYLCLTLFNKKFNVMMLEEQLKKYYIFSYAGAFSIKKKSEESNESLDYAIELLKDPQNVVLMFPQGKIQSQYVEQLHFRKGLHYITNNATNDFNLVYYTALIDYFSQRKPSAYIYLKNILNYKKLSLLELEKEYNMHYGYSKEQQKNLIE